MKTFLIIIILMFTLNTSMSAVAQQMKGPPSIKTTEQLGKVIDGILKKTRTAGVAVAMIQSDGSVWQYAAGFSDLKSKTTITNHTQFRLGSISKMFVSLSVMSLVEKGKLNLNDKVRDLAPDVSFKNPWENEYPLKLSHLLEHTTGWDAPHFPEQAINKNTPVTTKEAIDLHPHSRVSRWPAGSRTAYNQTGPLVAAYIVEKITGMSFEKYVTQQFLTPLSMNNTGYFFTEDYKNNAAINYRGRTPQPYWHLSNRAAGAMNSNLDDMVKLATFFLQRGMVGEQSLISKQSLTTTENPYNALSAQKGMQLNWGLGNFVVHHNGYIYHGHEGSLFGSNALIAYQADLGVAHIVMSNGEGPAVSIIHKLLSQFETQSAPKVAPLKATPINPKFFKLSGLYRPINPVRDDANFLTRLAPWMLSITNKGAFIKPVLGGNKRELIASGNGTFKQNTTGKIALITAEDPIVGTVVHYGPQTLQKIGAISAYLPFLVIVIWALSSIISIIFALIWVPRLLLKKLINGPHIQVRLWPLVNIIATLVTLLTFYKMNNSIFPFALAGNITFSSLMIFFGTIIIATSSIWSVITIWKNRSIKMSRFVFWHSTLLASTSSIMSLYLLSFGVIGIRLWT